MHIQTHKFVRRISVAKCGLHSRKISRYDRAEVYGQLHSRSFVTCTGHPRAVKAVNSKNVQECVGSKVILGVNSDGSYVDLVR